VRFKNLWVSSCDINCCELQKPRKLYSKYIIWLYLIKGGEVVDRINGAHVPELAKKTATHSQVMAAPVRPPAPKEVSSEADMKCVVW